MKSYSKVDLLLDHLHLLKKLLIHLLQHLMDHLVYLVFLVLYFPRFLLLNCYNCSLDFEYLTLTETDPDGDGKSTTGEFIGTISLAAGATVQGDGVLQVIDVVGSTDNITTTDTGSDPVETDLFFKMFGEYHGYSIIPEQK